MATSYKSFSLWLLASLIVGAGLGAYLAVQWKERQIERRVAAAIQVEQDRQAPLQAEIETLRQALDRERLQVEIAGIAVEVESKNFGLARLRLRQFGEDLRAFAERIGASETAAIQEVLAKQEEIVADLEALDPQAVEKLRQLFVDLEQALVSE